MDKIFVIQFDNTIFNEFDSIEECRDYLISNYGYDIEKIEINGREIEIPFVNFRLIHREEYGGNEDILIVRYDKIIEEGNSDLSGTIKQLFRDMRIKEIIDIIDKEI